MNVKLKKIFFTGESRDVFKGMMTLLVGAGLARLVGLISIPILARIYTPEDYGVLALYTALIAVITPIMTLRYVHAIPLPKTDVMAFNLFTVCLKLIFIFSIVIASILVVWGEGLLSWLNMEALIPWRWLIFLGVVGTSLYELFSLWATRKKQYKVIAKTQFTQSLIGNVVKITLGLLGYKPSGMIIGQFLSQSAGITSFLKSAREDFKAYTSRISLSKEKLVAGYYRYFVWFRLPSQFLMVLSVQAPLLMMATLFSTNIVGQFGLAKMVVMIPSSLIGQAVAKAYYAEVASLGKNNVKRIQTLTLNVQKKLMLFGAPPIIVFAMLSPWLFVVVFGEGWIVAGEYARILSPYILLMLISTPLIQVLNIVGSQLTFLMINVCRVLGLLSLFYLAKYFELTAYEFVIAFTVFSSCYAITQMLLVFYYVNRAVRMERK
jgi:O-antigen/teichoic acid export membrane protein